MDAFEDKESLTLPDIFSVPFTSRIYLNTLRKDEGDNGQDSFARVSSTFMYRYTGRVLASTIKGQHTQLKFFETMDRRVYILLVLSIFIISLVLAISRVSNSNFFCKLWSQLLIILSDNYLKKTAMRSTAERLLTAVWLMSCTVFMAAFLGLSRDSMIKPKPIYWIDSWADLAYLAKWQHLAIVTTYASDLNFYINNFKNENIAQKFAKRIELFNNDDLNNEPTMWDKRVKFREVKDGEAALVGDLYYLDTLKQNLVSRYGMIEDLDFHVSKSDDIASQPSFIVTNRLTINNSMASKLNLV